MQIFYRLLINNVIASITNFTVWFAITFYTFLETKSVFATGMISGIYLAVKEDPMRVEYAGNVDVYAGHGANMAFRRTVLDELGGFDEALGAGGELYSCEDIDIRVRVLDRGHRLIYLPTAIAYHKQERTWSAVRSVQKSYAKGVGACYVKYMRCGRFYGLKMLLRWFLNLGFREIAVGMLLLRPPRILNGAYQLFLPILGAWSGLRFPLDRVRMLYAPPVQS